MLGLGVSGEGDAEGGVEGMLSWLLALQVFCEALEGCGSCVDTATAAEIEPRGHACPSASTLLLPSKCFCSLPGQTQRPVVTIYWLV